MKLYEFEGKKLLRRYGINVPSSVVARNHSKYSFHFPAVLKAQVLSGNRLAKGGIVKVASAAGAAKAMRTLFAHEIGGEIVRKILIEEHVPSLAEYYISITYDTDTRGPVLAVSPFGGSTIRRVLVVPFDIADGLNPFFARRVLLDAKFHQEDINALAGIIERLWRLFLQEQAVLAEINPLFKTKDGRFVAGDAKIILDDEKFIPDRRRFLKMDGDIAVLASGGGASLICIDALIRAGGKPANYTEYSGNPPRDVVRALTRKVLSQPGLRGCWTVGGTANFTDIYETMSGFIEGLRSIRPKPHYPIVIRRDGPRQKEAFEMLKSVAEKEKYAIHLFGSDVSMEATAKMIVKLAYNN